MQVASARTVTANLLYLSVCLSVFVSFCLISVLLIPEIHQAAYNLLGLRAKDSRPALARTHPSNCIRNRFQEEIGIGRLHWQEKWDIMVLLSAERK